MKLIKLGDARYVQSTHIEEVALTANRDRVAVSLASGETVYMIPEYGVSAWETLRLLVEAVDSANAVATG